MCIFLMVWQSYSWLFMPEKRKFMFTKKICTSTQNCKQPKFPTYGTSIHQNTISTKNNKLSINTTTRMDIWHFLILLGMYTLGSWVPAQSYIIKFFIYLLFHVYEGQVLTRSLFCSIKYKFLKANSKLISWKKNCSSD